MQPIIFHLDMNSYFASVEQQDHPEWRGKPLGVCEHLGGIIIAASVEAKKWGIKTGTPVWEARKLFPKIILTQTHAERYRFFTRRFLKVVSDYTDKVEPYSIDEVFFDATKACNIKVPRIKFQEPNNFQFSIFNFQIAGVRMFYQKMRCDLVDADPWEEAINLAVAIKKRFKAEVGDWLRCSIGVADNKLLAKIGSDMQKPDGLVIIMNKNDKIDINDKNEPPGCLILSKFDLYQCLKLTDVPGIGHRQEKNLKALGIRTLAELRDYPRSHLIARFGKVVGYHLYCMGQLRGSWKAAVHHEPEIKSMGHMYTLPREYRKPDFFLPMLYKLCEMVARRLRRKQLMGNIVHFFYHDKNYQGFGDSHKLGYFLQDGREVFLECLRMMGIARSTLFFSPSGGDVSSEARDREGAEARIGDYKIIGVTVAGLKPYDHQRSLFGDVERERRLLAALDKINEKHGEFSIMRALQLPAGKVFRDSVGFGRVKEL